MTVNRFWILCCVLFFPLLLQAQFVDYGADPGRLKWNYVKTPHYKVIYPLGNDSMAYRYTLFLENVYPHLSKTIGEPVKTGTYPVVLHPGNMQSNGMVAWAPRRMELITNASTSLYAQSWDRQLVVHESRHILQTGRFMRGVFRPLYFLGGEQINGVASFAVPKWFFEGDAVSTETAMSNSGRGRLPEFNMYYRTRYLSGDFFSFDKWFMGSYKDYTGSFYALGYDMTAFARREYGADIWKNVTGRYVKRIYRLPPFSSALKHYTGVNTKGLFDQTFAYLGEQWKEQDMIWKDDEQSGQFARPVYVSPEPRRYTSYQYPMALNDSTVLAVKSSLSDLNALVELCNGQEVFHTYLGNISSRPVIHERTIYWTEYVSGLRWTHENYSVVKNYNLDTKEIRTITHRSRYLSPAVHPYGETAIVSETTFEGENRIVSLNLKTGEMIKTYPVPENGFVKDLAFGHDIFYVLLITDEGISVRHYNPKFEEWTIIHDEAVSFNISSLHLKNGELWAESGLNGINNIYNLNYGDFNRVSNSRYGAFMPSVTTDGSYLFYAEYAPNGHRIARVPVGEKAFPGEYTYPEYYPDNELAHIISQQEAFNLDTVTLEPVAFEPKRYHKLPHLFNVHSWAPFYYDVNEAVNLNTDDFKTIVKPGVMFLSQNHLNTAVTQLGYYYKDREHHGKLSFLYTGWYPVIDMNVEYGGKAMDIVWQKEDESIYTSGYLPGRKLVEAETRVYVPFNFTRNHYVRGLQPSVTWYLTNNRYQQIESGKMRNFQYLLSEIRYYHYRKMATRDILPRWGYQLRLQHLTLPLNTENYGDLYAARLITYWPGLLRNHSLMLRGGYQYQSVDDKALYVPKRLLDEPRGYHYNYRSRQQVAIKADYAFSLFCPDVSLGAWAYIQRVRTNLFYDLSTTQMRKDGDWINQSSYGADLIVDWNIFRLNYPISLGLRMIQPIDYGNFQVEGLFSVSF